MSWLERLWMPPKSVLSGLPGDGLDLTAAEQQALLRLQNVCPVCAQNPSAGEVCRSCQSQPPHFNRARVAFDYEMPISAWISQLKYSGQTDRARLLAQLWLREFGASVDQRVDAILPVPIHVQRYRQRGFNQAEILASVLAKNLQIPLLAKSVKRIRNTPAQAGLDARQRQTNLVGAFDMDVTSLQGIKRIAVVDDVMTTNATMNEVAKQLRHQTEIEWIEVWAIAKTRK